jgi:hypothetical protein
MATKKEKLSFESLSFYKKTESGYLRFAVLRFAAFFTVFFAAFFTVFFAAFFTVFFAAGFRFATFLTAFFAVFFFAAIGLVMLLRLILSTHSYKQFHMNAF